MGIKQFLEALANGEEGKGKSAFQQQNPETLKEAFRIFSEENTFKPGDLVEWKGPNMKNRRAVGPFVVVKVLDEPVFDEHDSGSPMFREPLDIVCGICDSNDGEFMCFHMDSRRLRHHISDVDASAQ